MKFFTYILSFYILFLATAPGVKAMYAGLSKQEQKVDCCNKSCSDKEDASLQKENGSSNNNTADNCSPLEACYGCIGYTVNVSRVSISILPMFYADKPLGTVRDKLSSDFSSDFWQPPRLG